MSVVAIIGAGDLGGALASRLASRDRVREVRLIDAAGGVAAGKALDILQAGPVEGSTTRVITPGQGDLSAVAGAAVIVIADEVGPPVKEIQAEAGLALLGRLRSVNPNAPIVCAGASQAWLVAHGAAELGIPASHIVGSAPLALVAAVKALVALELNGSARDVSLTLAGQPPQAVAIPWQTASVNGESLERLLDAPALRRIESRVRYLWPPGPYARAAAARPSAPSRRTRPATVARQPPPAPARAAAASPGRQGRRAAHAPRRVRYASSRGQVPDAGRFALPICPPSAPSSTSRWTRSSETQRVLCPSPPR